MPKIPDVIKKGLECCWVSRTETGLVDCGQCPYWGKYGCPTGKEKLGNDAIALIQQLQAENAEKAERIRVQESRNNALYHTILGVMHFVEKWIDCPAYDPDEDLNGTTAIGRASHAMETTLQAIEQLEAERDAAVKALKDFGGCMACNSASVSKLDSPCRECICDGIVTHDYWMWRGVQKEEAK